MIGSIQKRFLNMMDRLIYLYINLFHIKFNNVKLYNTIHSSNYFNIYVFLGFNTISNVNFIFALFYSFTQIVVKLKRSILFNFLLVLKGLLLLIVLKTNIVLPKRLRIK